MTDTRSQILTTLKTALRRDQRPPHAAEQRLRERPVNLVPERGQGDHEDKIQLFSGEAQLVEASVVRISALSAAPAAVTGFLGDHNLPSQVRVAPSLKDIAWATQPMLKAEQGLPQADDPTSITMAFGGVAETGTLVFLSGPDNPTTLNYVTPNHIAVVAAQDIAGDYETVWGRIRAENKAPEGKFMPRTVSWVTGPSRSADIEQTLLLGAHGPQRLHIVIVDEPQD